MFLYFSLIFLIVIFHRLFFFCIQHLRCLLPTPQDGRTPLSWAAEKGHESCVTELLAGKPENEATGKASINMLDKVRAWLAALVLFPESFPKT